MHFDETYDVIVVGSGLAGGIAAITAADAGARVLLIEKSEVPGGLSICSYGAVRSARDAEGAFAYLKATNDGRTPDEVLRVLAQGMCELEAYVRDLARINNAVISTSVAEAASGGDDPEKRRVGANYPLPGNEAFYHTTVVDVPGFDAKQHYPWANGAPGGPRLYKIVHDHLAKRGIEIRLATPARRLVADAATREVRGVRVAANGAERTIEARRGVILASGGFEGNADMKANSSKASRCSMLPRAPILATAFAWRRISAPRYGTCGISTAPTASVTPISPTLMRYGSSASPTGFQGSSIARA